ncbi:PilZ domain-containing protein [Candidatus Omnitrophota bacterium]
MMPKKERRRRKRIDIVLPIKIEYNNQRLWALTKNISVLGAYVETDQDIPRGAAMEIQIKLPKPGKQKNAQAKEIKCIGIAFRTQSAIAQEKISQYGVGIFFRAFLEGGEKQLSKFIDYILEQEKKIGVIYRRKRKKKKGSVK